MSIYLKVYSQSCCNCVLDAPKHRMTKKSGPFATRSKTLACYVDTPF